MISPNFSTTSGRQIPHELGAARRSVSKPAGCSSSSSVSIFGHPTLCNTCSGVSTRGSLKRQCIWSRV